MKDKLFLFPFAFYLLNGRGRRAPPFYRATAPPARHSSTPMNVKRNCAGQKRAAHPVHAPQPNLQERRWPPARLPPPPFFLPAPLPAFFLRRESVMTTLFDSSRRNVR